MFDVEGSVPVIFVSSQLITAPGRVFIPFRAKRTAVEFGVYFSTSFRKVVSSQRSRESFGSESPKLPVSKNGQSPAE